MPHQPGNLAWSGSHDQGPREERGRAWAGCGCAAPSGWEEGGQHQQRPWSHSRGAAEGPHSVTGQRQLGRDLGRWRAGQKHHAGSTPSLKTGDAPVPT